MLFQFQIYLECLPENKDELVIKIKETRNFYDEINKKYHIDLNELVKRNCQEDNPLSQHQDVSINKFCK